MKKIFKLENLIYLIILALPSYLLRFEFLDFSLNALDCLIGLSLLVWLVFYRKEIDWGLLFEKYKVFVFSVGLIFFGLVSSVLINKNYIAGLGIIKSWFLLPFLFSLIVRSVVKDDKLENIFLTYYLSAFLVALISLGYFFQGIVTYDLRLQGFFNSPNYLAMYLSPAIFILLYLFENSKRWKREAFLIAGFFILGALYFTYSYASWLSVVLALAFIFAVKKKLTWKKVLVSLLFLFVLFFSQLERDKLVDLIGANGRSSFSSRVMIWQSAKKMLEDNWFWGIGAGNFQESYLAYQKYFPAYLEWAVPHPHNVFLSFWLYGGIFGLAGFLALVYFWFLYVWRSEKKTNLKVIGLGIMIYILFHGLVDTTYLKNDLAVVFWLLFALL
jgi:O-antigen ligase